MLSLALFWGERVVVCVCAAFSSSGPGLEAARAQSFANRKVFRVGWPDDIMVESNGRGSGGALEASLQTKLHQDIGPMLMLLHPSKLLLDNLVMKPQLRSAETKILLPKCAMETPRLRHGEVVCVEQMPWGMASPMLVDPRLSPLGFIRAGDASAWGLLLVVVVVVVRHQPFFAVTNLSYFATFYHHHHRCCYSSSYCSLP